MGDFVHKQIGMGYCMFQSLHVIVGFGWLDSSDEKRMIVVARVFFYI
jgi:hypothetical protein